ncbi:SpoIIE family protein phosphatase [bacterium]|nr:SpoIIE family protein phosphatase [bacterium]
MSELNPKRADPRRAVTWRLALIVILCCAAAWPLRALIPWVPALLFGAGWTAAALFLLQESAVRRLWIVYLALTLPILLLSGADPTGRYIAVALNFCFLMLRRHRPWRHLSSAKRAAAFFLGLVASFLLYWDWVWPDTGELGWFTGFVSNFARTCLGSLRLFWIFSLLRLLFGVRLHFLRLRPKLAVMGALVAAIPLLLLTAFGLVALYGAMGGVTTARGRDVLQDWAANPAAIRHAADGVGFVWSDGRALGSPPAWLDDFRTTLSLPAPAPGEEVADARGMHLTIAGEEQLVRTGAWTPADTAAVFRVAGELWLLEVSDLAAGGPRITGVPLDTGVLDHLSALLRADVGIVVDADDLADADGEAPLDSLLASVKLQGAYRDSSGTSFWRRSLYFGGAQVPLIALADDHFAFGDFLMHVKVRLTDLGGEFTSGENNFNQAVLVILALIAGMLLLIQAVAVFLGLRITNGITSAVSALRTGTQRLAGGDLETRIHVPNEDEFGDLADSFNEMAVAVKLGREEAVARERLEKELETARAIQERLLPHEMPSLPGFEITGASIPSLQVGGDYFDFLDLGDGRLGVAIGDVSGKGIPAALLMSNLQASLHGQVLHPGRISAVVRRVNDLLVKSTDPHMFATFFYGLLDRGTGVFTYTNAGHNPPLLRRGDGEIVMLEAGGLPLGMLEDVDFVQDAVTIEPGDALLLFTDGITEAVGPLPDGSVPEDEDTVDAMFGDERLVDLLAASRGSNAFEIRETVLRAVSDHTAGVPQSDDITLVVVTRSGS